MMELISREELGWSHGLLRRLRPVLVAHRREGRTYYDRQTVCAAESHPTMLEYRQRAAEQAEQQRAGEMRRAGEAEQRALEAAELASAYSQHTDEPINELTIGSIEAILRVATHSGLRSVLAKRHRELMDQSKLAERKRLLALRREIAKHFKIRVAQVTEEHVDEYAEFHQCDRAVLSIVADTKASRRAADDAALQARQAAEQEAVKQQQRKQACLTLGIEYDGRLLYGAQAAAGAMGVSVGTLKRFVEPIDHATNPRYTSAAPVGLYDPMDLVAALSNPKVQECRAKLAQRRIAAKKATQTRCDRMVERMQSAELSIVRGKTEEEIHRLASTTHGGNYQGNPGPFIWSNRTARNCIRHNLTNYEDLWSEINRGYTGEVAYMILRERIDKLVVEAYPQYASDLEAE